MATITERITKNGSKRYRAEIRLKGHPHQTATFSLLTDAKKWALLTEKKIKAARIKALMESAAS